MHEGTVLVYSVNGECVCSLLVKAMVGVTILEEKASGDKNAIDYVP